VSQGKKNIMKKYCLLFFSAVFYSLNSYAQNIKLLDANDPVICKKISDITQAFAEGVSDKYKISVRSVSFLRTNPGVSCYIIVDTPNGKKECLAGSAVINSSGEYLAHPFLKRKNEEGYWNIGGSCL
jgi:hypothetical protein